MRITFYRSLPDIIFRMLHFHKYCDHYLHAMIEELENGTNLCLVDGDCPAYSSCNSNDCVYAHIKQRQSTYSGSSLFFWIPIKSLLLTVCGIIYLQYIIKEKKERSLIMSLVQFMLWTTSNKQKFSRLIYHIICKKRSNYSRKNNTA